MKFFCGYSILFLYNLFNVKKTLLFFTLGFITQYNISAQDTKTVTTFKDSKLNNAVFAFTASDKLFSFHPEKERTFFVGQKIAFTPDTAAINARYKPDKNPLLIWNMRIL